jgi:hypothetical protein
MAAPCDRLDGEAADTEPEQAIFVVYVEQVDAIGPDCSVVHRH